MNKKIFIAIGLLLAIIFTFNMTFANNAMQDAVDGVRNVVGGAENAVEGAVRDISNASRNATGAMQNTANEATNAMTDDRNNDGTNITTTTNNANDNNNNNTSNTNNNNTTTLTNNNDGGYTATRTGLTDNTTFMGMGATAWTWLILGIAAIAIVALVWYYSMQVTSSNTHRD